MDNDSNVNYIALDLPMQHAYLGDELQQTRDYVMYEEDTVVKLPILSDENIVLMPGCVLPLGTSHSNTIAIIEEALHNTNAVIGFINTRQLHLTDVSPVVGTTVHIKSFKLVNNIYEENNDRKIVAIGKSQQVFVLENSYDYSNGRNNIGRCRIISQNKLLHPLQKIKIYNSFEVSSILSQWPPWIYKRYEEENLIREVQTLISGWSKSLTKEIASKNPLQFGYWVASNIMADTSSKLKLLGEVEPILRLRKIINILKLMNVACCKDCEVEIAQKEDMTIVSRPGPCAIFANPGGINYEIITFRNIFNVRNGKVEMSSNCWFPGYKYEMVECIECGNLIGWQFRYQNKRIKPINFWGLISSSLIFLPRK